MSISSRDSLNFDEHDLLDLLIQIAADRPNFIVPNLERITFANNEVSVNLKH